MSTSPANPADLLCERCGYPIEAAARACPECGRPVSDSLPAARSGSPWQRAPSPQSWILTAALVLGPGRLFSRIRMETARAVWLLRINHALAALLVAAALAEDRIDEVFLHRDASATRLLGSLLLVSPIAYIVLAGMTAIERAGLRFFGNRRGGRLTPEITLAVAAHASYGWILAGLLAVVGAFVGHALLRPWYNRQGAGWILAAPAAHVTSAAAGFFLGLLAFETLSYIGAMRCRFANLPRPPGEPMNDPPPGDEPTLDRDVHTTPDTTDPTG